MDGISIEVERDGSGRFVAGQSGNPAGKLPGTRNRKTVMAEALRDGEGEAVARVVIEKALAGDVVAAKFCLGLISPRPRGRTIHLDLPEDGDCNVVAAFNATLRALADGEITPDEAVTVSRFLDGRRRVLQAWQLEDKLTAYGRTIPGDPEWAEEDPAADDDEAVDEDEADDEVEVDAELAAMTGPEPGSVPLDGTPLAAPGKDGETPRPPRRRGAPPAAGPAAADLHSACISRSPIAPRTSRGIASLASDDRLAVLAAIFAREEAAQSAPR